MAAADFIKEGHVGQHLDNASGPLQVCEECLTFYQCWSLTAGEVQAWKHVIQDLKRRAGEAFTKERDDKARDLRALAIEYELSKIYVDAKAELDAFNGAKDTYKKKIS